jgi:protein-S-isoprenylcysteine O-methyltransferase Ste14
MDHSGDAAQIVACEGRLTGPSSTAFISGSIVIFWNGLHEGIPLLNGVAGGLIAFLSVWLYEWTRRTVEGRGFYIGFGGQVPSAVCEQGPYRYLRHPFY